MKWCRLYAEFATDPKVQQMSEEMQRRLIMLFCLHTNGDLPGATNEELLTAFRIKKNQLLKTFEIFSEKGFIDEHWNLINWKKRQFQSDDVAVRVRKYRESKFGTKCNVTETLLKRKCNALDTDTDTDTEKELKILSASEDAAQGNGEPFYLTKKKRKLTGKRLETFDRFWEAFDYKKGRAEAADSWLGILSLTDSLVEKIVTAAQEEAERREDLIASGRTPKMAQGWLSGRRWEDECQDDGEQKWVREYKKEKAEREGLRNT